MHILKQGNQGLNMVKRGGCENMPNSPQLENGYTKIVNKVMDALAKYRIPGEQMQCLVFILRKTYGWNKKEDDISLSQFVDGTGINKPCVVRAINGLKDKKIITVIKKDNKTTTTYRFNKRYTTWKPLSKKITVIKKDNKPLSKKIHTKETIQKKYPEIINFTEKFIKYAIKKHGKKAPGDSISTLKSSCDTIDKLIRIDGFGKEYIYKVIRWAVKDEFWGDNVISLAALRNKKNGGQTKFQKIAVKCDAENKPQNPNELNPDYIPDDEKQYCPDMKIY